MCEEMDNYFDHVCNKYYPQIVEYNIYEAFV